MRPSSGVSLLVEGPDDKWSLIALLKHALAAEGLDWDQIPWRPNVEDKGGVDAVLDSLGVSLKSATRLGVVVDADDDRDARWAAVRDRLRRAGVEVPETPPAAGHVGPGWLPDSRVGVWVMPDNRLPGVVEDFLVALVPQGDPCWAFAEEAAARALVLAPVERNAAWRSKARLHTWLAWQDRPGQPLGQAITSRVLGETGHPQARAFVDWFGRLFRP